jgi:uncharacterized protein (TIGR02996 family)
MADSRDLEAILRACKADPTDDDVRRILADCLEDLGQAERAEFVRLQLDLLAEEERREWQPTEAELEARQIRLLRKNARDWLGGPWSAYGWVDVPTEKPSQHTTVKFERGLACVQLGKAPKEQLRMVLPPGASAWLEQVESGLIINNNVWAELCAGQCFDGFSDLRIGWNKPDVATLVGLLERVLPKRLSLSMDDPGRNLLPTLAACRWFRPHVLDLETFPGWDEFAISPALSAVRNLTLQVRDAGNPLAALAGSPHLGNLRKLFLSGDELDTASLTRLLHSQHLTNLRDLAITSYDGRGSPGIATALRDCRTLSALVDLDLFMNPLDSANAALLAKSPALAGVRILKLHSSEVNGPAAKALFESPHLGSLECVDLSCNPIGNVGLATLATAPALENLRQLDLCKTEVGDEGLRTLVESPRFGQLELLDLAGNNVEDAGFQALAGASGCRLRNLDLGSMQPGRAGWQALTRSGVLRQLVHLEATRIGAGPDEAADLARADLPELRVLKFAYNPMGPSGARALAEAQWLDQLVVLHLYEDQLGDDGLIALLSRLRSGTLAELWIQKNGLGPRAGRALLEWPGLPHLVQLWLEDPGLGDLADEIQAVLQAGPR